MRCLHQAVEVEGLCPDCDAYVCKLQVVVEVPRHALALGVSPAVEAHAALVSAAEAWRKERIECAPSR